MRTLTSVTLAAAIVAITSPLHAQTTVLNFEETVCAPNAQAVTFGAYSFAGFNISTVSAVPPANTVLLAVWCPANVGGFAGSKALFADNTQSSITTLGRSDAGAFGITSIKLANVIGNSRGGPITFLGTTTDGTEVSQLFVVPVNSTPVLSLFTFGANFTNLRSLQWTTGPTNTTCTVTNNTGSCINGGLANVQFDDVTLTTVAPEPGTIVLTLAGLLATVATARARARRSA